MIRLIFLFFLFIQIPGFSQNIGVGNQNVDEYFRRIDLDEYKVTNRGWMLRYASGTLKEIFKTNDTLPIENKIFNYHLLPIFNTLKIDGKRPFLGDEYGLIPGKGFQNYISAGFSANVSILHIQFQPEFVVAQNLPYNGFANTFSDWFSSSRFLFWNVGDSPERFGEDTYTKFFLGQSFVGIKYKSFEIGAGTRNYWWGPGQFVVLPKIPASG